MSPRAKAILKLVLLIGVPLLVVTGIFGGGVYCGFKNRRAVLMFEKEWLGFDVEVPKSPWEKRFDKVFAAVDAEPADGTPPDGKADPKAQPDGKAEPKDPPDGKAEPKDPPDGKAEPKTPPEPQPKPVPEPVPTPAPEVVDPYASIPVAAIADVDQTHKARYDRIRTVTVKVLADRVLIAEHPDWVAYTSANVEAASKTFRNVFGIELRLYGVVEWDVPEQGMTGEQLIDDLRTRPREGADILVGLTNRPFDGKDGGLSDRVPEKAHRNGAYALVYAQPKRTHGHQRSLLHELSHLFGAEDVLKNDDPAWQAGSWMSYAGVPDGTVPVLDAENQNRVLERKDWPFRNEPPADDPRKIQ